MELFQTAGFTALIMGLLHYFPWAKLTGRPLPRLAAYILGVLGISIPLSGLLLHWGETHALAALWLLAAAGGLVTVACYALDALADKHAEADGANRREQALLNRMTEDDNA